MTAPTATKTRHPLRALAAIGMATAAVTGVITVCNYDPASLPAPARGSNEELIVPAGYDVINQRDQVGAFRTNCQRSHYGHFDPIVYPGQESAAHLHMFFGATGINGMTGAEPDPAARTSPLDAPSSTCEGGLVNRTAYWVPAMLTADGKVVDAAPIRDSIQVYYKTTHYDGWQTATVAKWFEPGLKMIAGNAKGQALDTRRVWWSCQPRLEWNDGRGTYSYRADGNPTRYNHIPRSCPRGDGIQLAVEFPSCWNGRDLDSPDHKSHMSYGNPDNRSGCPASHPVPVPAITEFIRWVSPGPGSELNGWHLSSDFGWTDRQARPSLPAGQQGWGTSAHADWWNGWNGQTTTQIVNNCYVPRLDCSMNLLGNGLMLTFDPDAGKAENRRVAPDAEPLTAPPNAAPTPN